MKFKLTKISRREFKFRKLRNDVILESVQARRGRNLSARSASLSSRYSTAVIRYRGTYARDHGLPCLTSAAITDRRWRWYSRDTHSDAW